jgi:ubiquinone/menaquinone biosynthesis C-methylase UbiE
MSDLCATVSAYCEALLCNAIFWLVYSMMRIYRLTASVVPAVPTVAAGSALMRRTYNRTAHWYDLLDYPWEREYRTWRPLLAGDLTGSVLDLGVGTGRNLAHFCAGARVTGVDISEAMVRLAERKCALGGGPATACTVDRLVVCDATDMRDLEDGSFDCALATFIFCVLPEVMQARAVDELARVLKPGGIFRLLEIVFSKDAAKRANQERWAPFVEMVYGAKFDRSTLAHVQAHPRLEVTGTRFLKADIYLLIEGRRKA